MKKFLIILLAFTFAAELEVDGDLRVTGNIQNDSLTLVIANLQAQITALQIQAAQFECENFGNIPPGYCDCFGNILDICGECGGDTISEDQCFIIDTHDNVYATVIIGNQRWMAENLRTMHYANGDDVPGVGENADWQMTNAGGYSSYENTPSNVQIYGQLYNWYAVNDYRNLCIEGWHVPSYDEWQILIDFVSGDGGSLKEEGYDHWSVPNSGATNESGFSARPGGYRNSNGSFSELEMMTYFWTSSENGSTYGLTKFLKYNEIAIFEGGSQKQYGHSVRCIQD